MNEEDKNFDSQVTNPDDPIREPEKIPPVKEPDKPAASGGETKKKELKDLAEAASVVSYGYIKDLKMMGHNSLGNLVFQETMKMLVAASIASESIGKDRFMENLESGFYSSGTILVYLNFAEILGTNDTVRIMLIDSVTTIHKIFAASVKTVRSRMPKMAETTAI